MRGAGVFATVAPLAAIVPAWVLALSRDPCKVFAVTATLCFAGLLCRLLAARGDAMEMHPALPSRKGRVGLWVALAAGAVAYAWTLPLYFLCDDFEHLESVSQPLSAVAWGQLTHGQIAGHLPIFFRPLPFLCLGLEVRLWHMWAPGYHITSILLHLLSVAAVFFLCEALELSSLASGSAALFFALMPVNVQAVTWTGCRFDQLAAVFMLWATVFYLWFRRSRRLSFLFLALGFFVLAALSKESAYALPLVWLALEFLVLDRPSRKAIAAFLGLAAACFLWRAAVLGGIGGYRYSRERPMASAVNTKAIAAVLFRQPAETLFGYNWLSPHSPLLVASIGLSAVLVIACILLVRIDRRSRRLLAFSLIWIYAAGIPTQSLFWWGYDSGLLSSRALYLASAGLALMIAVLLEWTCRRRAVQTGCVALLSCIFAAGIAHNLHSWNRAAALSRNFAVELHAIVPVPPPHAVFYIANVPMWREGVPVFVVGLSAAVRSTYGNRDDITVNRVDRLPRTAEPAAIRMVWTGKQERPVELVQ